MIVDKVKSWWWELRASYDEFLWKNGPERKELARERIKLHNLAMKEGRNSPYTHPEEYGF